MRARSLVIIHHPERIMVVYPIKCTIKYFLLLAYVYCLHLMLSWACYIINETVDPKITHET